MPRRVPIEALGCAGDIELETASGRTEGCVGCCGDDGDILDAVAAFS